MTTSEYRVTVQSEGATHDFLFIGGPIDDSANHAEVFTMLGIAASAWARLEQQLDAVLIHVNKTTVAELYHPEHPISFSGKIKLLKRWFNSHKALAALSEDMRQLTSGLKKLSPHRNLYIHSNLEGWSAATQVITFNSIRYEGNDEFRMRLVF